MKTPQALFTIWTCHSLEDFPVHYLGNDAASLLVGWTALWHPEFLRGAGRLPEWKRLEDADGDFAGALITIPAPTLRRLSEEQIARLKSQATVVCEPLDRDEQLFRPMLGDRFSSWRDPAARELSQTFFGLGYAWLQIQLMTRQLRYSSNLDQEAFAKWVLEAAGQACDGASGQAKESLTKAFDLLLEEKNRYYPVVANLVDLVLVPEEGTSGLAQQLSQPHRQNWLGNTSPLTDLLASDPALAQSVAQRQGGYRLELLSGLEADLPPQLLEPGGWVRSLARAYQTRSTWGSEPPAVFARRSAGLEAGLPQLLKLLGYQGALHLSLSGEALPLASAPLFSWQAPDGTQISAISGGLLDAGSAGAFLKLGVTIGEQIDSYHSATVVFAHWAGVYHDLFQDFLAANQYGELFGRFQIATDVFESYFNPGYGEVFEQDDYRDRTLMNLVQDRAVNPISRFVDYWSLVNRLKSLGLLASVIAVLREKPATCRGALEQWERQLHRELLAPAGWSFGVELCSALDSLTQELMKELQTTLTGLAGEKTASSSRMLRFNGERQGQVVPVLAADRVHYAEIPDGGYAVTEGNPFLGSPVKTGGGHPAMVEERCLRNEFFRVEIDPRTGGVRNVKRYQPRARPIFSQQLAFARRENLNAPPTYSEMVASQVEWKQLTEFEACAESRGELRLDNQALATFRQTVTIYRGLPDIDFEIELTPRVSLGNHPWLEYLASRIAWHHESAIRWRTVLGQLTQCRLERFVSPQRIVIDDVEEPFWIEPRGLAFHYQGALRILDTLLVVAGETARTFRFSVRVAGGELDKRPRRPQPDECLVREMPAGTPTLDVGRARFLQVHPANLEIIDSRELEEAGRIGGVYLLVSERFNQNGRFHIRGPRAFRRAYAVDLQGRFLHDVEIVDGQAAGMYHGFQVFGLQLYW